MRETWYVLEDGSMGDPKDVAPDEKGKLVHKNGVAVKMRGPDVPHTSGVDIDAEQPTAPAINRQMNSKPGKSYKTR